MALKTNLVIFADAFVRGILTIIELALLLALSLGIQFSSAYFAWFVHQHLRPAMDVDADLFKTKEAFIYFSFLTIYSTVVAWGALPYYSIRKELPIQARSCLAGMFFLFSTSSAVVSIRVLFHMKLYWIRFVQADLPYLANHCHAMVILISALVGLNASLVITFVSFTMILGYPTVVSSTLQQMLTDTREVMKRVGFGVPIEQDNEDKGLA
ncbi:hypothetical protein FVEG_15988 [Fusarium verticillioides 7600]|uniref:Uncharacterized protein n=1 Tax=Gibberella moniliformis (strain M3125 / FGSC 7600) TaxID=334819 RepID=W7M4Q9_GIBM7|nr:hypothetical protein FVEG_15988 [Fusarium verticillioides 7600]EWG46563.1 hypothetical protein FVEG_15988 [Fusarium verticillioides 7600]